MSEIIVNEDTRETVGNMISKMGATLTEAQAPLHACCFQNWDESEARIDELREMIDNADTDSKNG